MNKKPETYSEAMKELVWYLHERESIRISKDLGKPSPWTKDTILGQYKFTNVLRADDRTTRWGVKNWFHPAHSRGVADSIILLNCGIYRFFGTTQFAQELGFQESFDPEFIKEVAARMESQGRKLFTSAYVISNGGYRCPKREAVVDIFLTNLNKNLEFVLGKRENSFERYAKRLYRVNGFGGTGFMAKEVLSDLHLSGAVSPFEDRYDWTPVGPGALRGLAWMFPGTKVGRADKALPYMRQIADDLSRSLEPWMPQFGASLDLHGVQFAMCEIDKYLRTKYNGGKPKQSYKPWSES
jgi:hypothetical protein